MCVQPVLYNTFSRRQVEGFEVWGERGVVWAELVCVRAYFVLSNETPTQGPSWKYHRWVLRDVDALLAPSANLIAKKQGKCIVNSD